MQDSKPYDLSLDVETKNIREHSGVLLVAYGGSGAKAPPLATRPNMNVASIKILGFVRAKRRSETYIRAERLKRAL